MEQNDRQHDVSAPAPVGRLATAVALWGGGAAVLAIGVAVSQGVLGASLLGVLCVVAASLAGFGVLKSFSPRPTAGWALPMLASQMVRTLLAPALGLGASLLSGTDTFGFWLTVLAVAGAMLVGETIVITSLLRRPAAGTLEGREVAA